MKRLAVVLLLFAAPAFAADTPEKAAPVLTLPKEKSAPVNFPAIIAPTMNTGGTVAWLLPDPGVEEVALADLFGPDIANQAKGRIFYARQPGRYRIWAVSASGSVVSPKAECTLIVGDAPPVPPGPNPPTPPGPTPPTPGPAPIPADGLHVLIVYESADLPKYPKDQQAILYGADIRSYLNSHCAPGSNGKAGWRVWDQNTPTGADEKIWADAMARKRDKLPWLIVSNPQKGGGYEGPLPATVADTMKLLTTYGGN